MSVLELDHVYYQYKNKYQTVNAVTDMNYAFDCGNMYAIVGKSGSGKTTVLSLMAGLDTPTKGRVLFDGVCTADKNRDMYRRNDVSVIYQTFNLFPLLTVLENVMYPMELKGISSYEARKKAEEMIGAVGLDERVYNRFPEMLSGGERQRIAIARALTTDCKVILADEPTGNLDVENTNNVIGVLKKLAHEKQYCVIVVTHDPAIAEAADIVLHVSDGTFLPIK